MSLNKANACVADVLCAHLTAQAHASLADFWLLLSVIGMS